MAGRVSLITGAIALLALAGCGGAAATPTPVPATPAPTTAATVTPAPATPAPSTPSSSVAPSTSPAGTTAPSGAPATGLEGAEWQLISISDGSVLNPIPENISVTMTLKGGVASGSSGCNTYTTPYSLDLQQILFGRVALTKKLCDDDANRVESNYIAALGAVARFGEQQAGMIFFSPSGAPVLLYLAAPTGTLAGDWSVTAYQDARGAIVAPVAGTPVTVSFLDDGQLSGSDGCNSFNGTYTETGVRMVVSGLSGTRVACPSDELTAQEEPFLAALQASTLWSASQTGLVLRGSNGIVTLTLERAAG